jgi:hypothetical protein
MICTDAASRLGQSGLARQKDDENIPRAGP